jgi:hypothetical protein
MYRPLQPGSWFRDLSPNEFTARYQADVLGPLNAAIVVDELMALAGPRRIPALLCFEPPDPRSPWCHRGLVSAWLHDELGLEVFELGQEHCGCGWRHPKIHLGLAQGVLDL